MVIFSDFRINNPITSQWPLLLTPIVLYGVALYFSLIFAIRRLHDRDHSGWLVLGFLLPLLNIVLMLYILFAPGHHAQNRYAQPGLTPDWETAFAVIYGLLLCCAFIFSIIAPWPKML